MPYDRSTFSTRTPLEGVCFDFALDQNSFLAPKLFPPKLVSKSLTKVYQSDGSSLRIPTSTAATSKTSAGIVDEQLFSREISLVEHKQRKEVDPRDVAEADVPWMLDENRAARVATRALLLAQEAAAATLATTTSNYPADLTSAIASGSRWNEAGGNPEADVQTAHRAVLARCGRTPNAAAMDFDTYSKLRTSPYLIDRIKYTSGDTISDAALKNLFGVEYLDIGKIRYNSAEEGAAVVMTNLWSTNVIFHVFNPSPQKEDISYGHTYTTSIPFAVDPWDDVSRRSRHGVIRFVEVNMEYALGKGFVVSSSDSDFAGGYLFTTAVA